MATLRIEDCVNDVCPWSGKRVSPDGLMRYRGRIVGFHDTRHRDRFLAAVIALETALAPVQSPDAAAVELPFPGRRESKP